MRTLKIENLNYQSILKNISMDIVKGSFNIFVGPNGSGKTTLFKCIIGLKKISGTITYDKEKIDYNKIFYVNSVYDFSYNISIIDIISAPVCDKKDKEIIRQKAYSICKKLDIEWLISKTGIQLLESEKLLLSLAQACLSKAEILIIDLSLDILDNYHKTLFLDYIKTTKKTIMMSTSNIEDIVYADNIILMDRGTIKKSVSMNELVQNTTDFKKKYGEIPFILDLADKLQFYNLINHTYLKEEEMILEIWK